MDKDELVALVEKIIDKMEADVKEAIANGYCKSLLQERLE